MSPSSSISPLLLLAASPVHAAEQVAPPTLDMLASLGQMALGLVVVLIVLLACLWTIKRLSAARSAIAGNMTVLGSVAVGPRERVVLVRVGEHVLVLGVAPGQVRTLHIMNADELTDVTDGSLAAANLKDFPVWLRQAMERRHAP